MTSSLCGARHPDALEDPKNYGTPCDYPAGHLPIADEEGTEWDHAYRFEGEPAMLWNGYLGEPKPEPKPWMAHEEIVRRLHAAHCEHLGWTEAELPVGSCGFCAMYAEWVAPLLAEAQEQGRRVGS